MEIIKMEKTPKKMVLVITKSVIKRKSLIKMILRVKKRTKNPSPCLLMKKNKKIWKGYSRSRKNESSLPNKKEKRMRNLPSAN